MTRKLIVICEARSDFELAANLADRILLAAVDWIDESLLDENRQWVGEPAPNIHLEWKTVAERARSLGIKTHGYFQGKPGLADAKAARRAIAYVARRFIDVEAILLVRDVDNKPERRQGLEQARADDRTGKTIVIGVAHVEIESWIICCYVPQSDLERKLLAIETRQLGWDPCSYPQRLTEFKADNALKSPKRVLNALTACDRERQVQCWKRADLATMSNRGKDNGLSAFLDELRNRLVPVFT